MPCQAEGCRAAGVYKAPKSKTALHEYRWYCLDHVRAYNQQWDFFAGMERGQIEAFMRDALTGHRPTWNREAHMQNHYDRLQDAIDAFLHLRARRSSQPPSMLNEQLREALAVMDMEYPYTAAALKIRYRALVKQFHPDVNKGDKTAEEKFKTITVSYLLLSEHIKTP